MRAGGPRRPRRRRRGSWRSCCTPRRRCRAGRRPRPAAAGERAHVHEQPQRQQAERRHRPERDLLAASWRPRRRAGRAWAAAAAAAAAAALRPTGPGGGGAAAAGAAAPVVAGVAAGASPRARRRRAGVAAEPERGAPIPRALQQVFGDLGHWACDVRRRRDPARTRSDSARLSHHDRRATGAPKSCPPSPARPDGRLRSRAHLSGDRVADDTVVPDCTSSHDVRCEYGSCRDVHERRSIEPTARRSSVRPSERTYRPTTPAERQPPARCSPSTSCKWPGVNVAVPACRSSARSRSRLAVIPYGKRRPVGKPVSWGEAMLGRGLRLRRDAARLRHRAPPVDRPRRPQPRLDTRTRSSTARAASCKPQTRRRVEPDHAAVRGGPRHRRRPDPRHLLRPASSSSGAGGRSAATRPQPGTEIATSSYGRPLVKKA